MTATAINGKEGTAPVGKLGIAVFREPAAIEREWRHLEASGTGTIFQRYDWADAWLATVGSARGVSPAILLGSIDGRPAFVLPFCIDRAGPARIAEWLGGTHSGYNFGLWSEEGARHLHALPRAELVRRIGEALEADAMVLRRVPLAHEGLPQPLAVLPSQESVVSGYSVSLEGGMDELLARTGGGARRRRANQKERRMRELGAVAYGPTATLDEALAALDFFAEQKALRLAEQGLANPFAEPGAMDFLRGLARRSQGARDPLLQLSTLSLDGVTRAVIGSGAHRGCVSLQILTFVHDETKPHSPGQVLLYRHIEAACAERRSVYDFGIGQEGYKDSWADTVHQLRDHYASFTAVGALALAALRLRDGAKARVRQNAWAARMMQGLRGREASETSS